MEKGHYHSKTTKDKISQTMQGKEPKNIKQFIRNGKKTRFQKGQTPWNKYLPKKQCEYCGKEFQPRTKTAKFCSRKCQNIGRIKPRFWLGKKRPEMIGENNYNWQNGKSFEPYTSEWTVILRESIRQRDNHICQLCSRTQKEELERYEQKLPVHHIDYDKKNCDPKNLITLCSSCNSKVNHNRNYWKNYFNLRIKL